MILQNIKKIKLNKNKSRLINLKTTTKIKILKVHRNSGCHVLSTCPREWSWMQDDFLPFATLSVHLFDMGPPLFASGLYCAETHHVQYLLSMAVC